ncbi:ABC transporter family protein [Luteibacter rhizovicinus]|uniref:ABC transporter family protein n=1 Tax=Luteibacter rhizovicinus TaxID=242606 RepID=A0A4R3YHG9_9GAMM|nr:ATP-binding cassette domain-containing protein [Luteibacter rhizovicinus]TCV91442.1 ABC transporter family protein [Luteibacter rhizovicinus]
MTLSIEGLRNALVGPFDLRVEAGRCTAIVGASGSGKSLFLRMVADLDVNEGAVSLAGDDRAAISAPAWRRRVGLVPAQPGWWGESVAEHFDADLRTRAAELADALRLPADIFARQIFQLSTGERQRLGLIRAMLADPDVLLLDEPTGSLDPEATLAVEALLRERLEAGVVAIVVTHDTAQAARLAHTVLRMEAGRLAPL